MDERGAAFVLQGSSSEMAMGVGLSKVVVPCTWLASRDAHMDESPAVRKHFAGRLRGYFPTDRQHSKDARGQCPRRA